LSLIVSVELSSPVAQNGSTVESWVWIVHSWICISFTRNFGVKGPFHWPKI